MILDRKYIGTLYKYSFHVVIFLLITDLISLAEI